MKTAFAILAASLFLAACTASLPQIADTVSQPTQADRVQAIKQALELGSTRAAELLSRTGGYSQSDLYRIELPEDLQPVTRRLRQVGLGGQLDRVDSLMNQAAEQAAAEARTVFVDTVREMTVADALGIVRGHDTAATDYFRQNTETVLRRRYLPIVQHHLQQLGFYNEYRSFLTAYEQLPLSNKPDLDLEEHVLQQSLNGLFHRLSVEERLIREDPLGRGSRLIERVFRQG